MRRRIMWALGLLLAIAPMLSAGEAAQLRILTYNTHHSEGVDKKLDLPRIAQVIRSAKPDLVALQEIDVKTRRTGGIDQAAELAKLTEMQVFFAKAMDYGGGEYGIAVLSRFEILEKKAHVLPFDGGSEPRAVAEVRVRPWADRPAIAFYCTHVEHAREDLRLKQVERLLQIVDEGESPLKVLAGDFNATPDSPPMKRLLESWTDTAGQWAAPTIPAAEPKERIDYVLIRGAGWKSMESKVVDEKVASDHRPVLSVIVNDAAGR